MRDKLPKVPMKDAGILNCLKFKVMKSTKKEGNLFPIVYIDEKFQEHI